MLLRVKLGLLCLLASLSSFGQSEDSLVFTTYYYEGGAKSSAGYLLDGKPEGYWRSYYRNGNLKAEGNRKNYQLDSVWIFYNENGQKTAEIPYDQGVKNGMVRSYEEGVLIKEEPYVSGDLQGWVRYYYDSGELEKEVPYADNKAEGTGFLYARNGRVIAILTYKGNRLIRKQGINRLDDQEQKQGLWITFYPNRNIKTEGPYVNDLKNGYWKYYKPNGDLIRVEKWSMGELQEGATEVNKVEIRRTIDPQSGKLATKGAYRDGVPVGVHRAYNEEGEVISAKIYEDGIVLSEGIIDEKGRKQGPWKFFYRDGSLRAEGAYSNDLKIGRWRYLFRNGDVEQIGNYLRGEPDGLWTWYFEEGAILRQEEYAMGLEDGLSVEYNDSGAVIAQGEYIGGYKEGPWFHQLNDHREEGAYFEGARNGIWKHYYLSNGQLRFQGAYENGLKTGDFIWYFPSGQVERRGSYIADKKEGIWEYFNKAGQRIITIEYENGAEIRYNGERIKYGRNYEKAIEREALPSN